MTPQKPNSKEMQRFIACIPYMIEMYEQWLNEQKYLTYDMKHSKMDNYKKGIQHYVTRFPSQHKEKPEVRTHKTSNSI